jgi:hypothetical protein
MSNLGVTLLLIEAPGLLGGGSDVVLDLSRDGLVRAESTSSEGGVKIFEIADEALGDALFV